MIGGRVLRRIVLWRFVHSHSFCIELHR